MKKLTMKNSIFLLSLVCTTCAFSQNTTTVSYDEIILDGKPAFINVATGEIVTNKPKGFSKNTSANQSTSNVSSITNSSTHRILKGETLYSISKKYGTSIADLKALNPSISINTLSIDQIINVKESVDETLVVPNTTTNEDINEAVAPKNYMVKKGETLYSISRKFNISVSDLKNKNNLTSNQLSIGQNLIIN